jgi:hypothetical protein
MEFVARHRYAYMGIPYFHFSVFERTFAMFRDICRTVGGYEPSPLQAGWLTPIVERPHRRVAGRLDGDAG